MTYLLDGLQSWDRAALLQPVTSQHTPGRELLSLAETSTQMQSVQGWFGSRLLANMGYVTVERAAAFLVTSHPPFLRKKGPAWAEPDWGAWDSAGRGRLRVLLLVLGPGGVLAQGLWVLISQVVAAPRDSSAEHIHRCLTRVGTLLWGLRGFFSAPCTLFIFCCNLC